MMYDKEFWNILDSLVNESQIIIDRPKNSAHPRYSDIIYPFDYGYLDGTSSMDGDGIDVWLGSDGSSDVVGILCTVDLVKRDSEMKILLGCTDDEQKIILDFQNQLALMKAILIKRKK